MSRVRHDMFPMGEMSGPPKTLAAPLLTQRRLPTQTPQGSPRDRLRWNSVRRAVWRLRAEMAWYASTLSFCQRANHCDYLRDDKRTEWKQPAPLTSCVQDRWSELSLDHYVCRRKMILLCHWGGRKNFLCPSGSF